MWFYVLFAYLVPSADACACQPEAALVNDIKARALVHLAVRASLVEDITYMRDIFITLS